MNKLSEPLLYWLQNIHLCHYSLKSSTSMEAIFLHPQGASCKFITVEAGGRPVDVPGSFPVKQLVPNRGHSRFLVHFLLPSPSYASLGLGVGRLGVRIFLKISGIFWGGKERFWKSWKQHSLGVSSLYGVYLFCNSLKPSQPFMLWTWRHAYCNPTIWASASCKFLNHITSMNDGPLNPKVLANSWMPKNSGLLRSWPSPSKLRKSSSRTKAWPRPLPFQSTVETVNLWI